MRLLALVAVAFLLTVFQTQAQIYGPYDGYDDFGGYGYDDPYSAIRHHSITIRRLPIKSPCMIAGNRRQAVQKEPSKS